MMTNEQIESVIGALQAIASNLTYVANFCEHVKYWGANFSASLNDDGVSDYSLTTLVDSVESIADALKANKRAED